MNGQYDKAKVLAQLDLPANMAASNVATFKEIGTDTKPKAAAAEATPKKTETVARAIAERAAQPKRSAKPVTRPKSKKRPTQVAAKPVFVSVGSANVRKGPSTKHAPVAFLQKGHQVRLLGKSSDGRWSYIALADGRRGYVFHKLIRPK